MTNGRRVNQLIGRFHGLGPNAQVFATNDKRHGSGEPSGFIGFPLRAGSTRGSFSEDQTQTPPKEGHQWSQIHSS
jgi:hypothetical protein